MAVAGHTCTVDAPSERLRRMLEGDWRDDPLKRQRLRQQLAASGEIVIPAFFLILSGEVEGDDPDARPQQPLDRVEQELVFEALADMPSTRVGEQLESYIGPESTTEDRILVLRILGRVGDSESLPVILRTALGFERVELYRPRVRTAFEGALCDALVRDPRGFSVLDRQFQMIDASIDESVVRALGKTSRAQGLPLLRRLLFRRSEVDALVLEALGRLDSRSLILGRDEAIALARPFLGGNEVSVQVRAADTLGKLGDMESFEELVFLLESENEILVHAAVRSLQQLTGLRLGEEPTRWMRWYANEKSWLAGHSRAAAIRVDSHDVGDACAALRELSEHTAFRDELVWDVVVGLEHSDTAVVSAACTALKRLDSPLAIPYLVEMLGDSRKGVDASLGACLRALTRQPLPDEPGPWHVWLEG